MCALLDISCRNGGPYPARTAGDDKTLARDAHDLFSDNDGRIGLERRAHGVRHDPFCGGMWPRRNAQGRRCTVSIHAMRSEEHTSELQSLMRITYAVFCLTNKI